jgi:hypothetical protein
MLNEEVSESFYIVFLLLLIYLIFRLEHDNDNTRANSHTYILPRMFPFITCFLWGAFAFFFRRKIRATISLACRDGNLSAFGGRLKRNIVTLGKALFSSIPYLYDYVNIYFLIVDINKTESADVD